MLDSLIINRSKLYEPHNRYLYPVDPTRLDQSGSMMDEEEESNVRKKKKD